MAVISTDDHVPTPGDKTCASKQEGGEGPCPGRKAHGFKHCLAHLEPAQLDQFLQSLGPGAELDAAGTPIDAELLDRILQAVRDEAGHPVFGSVSFEDAKFTEAADFKGAKFTGFANFIGAQFKEAADFKNSADFKGAQFRKGAGFAKASFSKWADFSDAQFAGDAHFTGAGLGDSYFESAKFTGAATFAEVHFRIAHFTGAKFAGDAIFVAADFSREARFEGAQFRQATYLGPLTADRLNLDAAVFDRRLVIEACASHVSCRRTIWKAGVTMRLRYATVNLERATLTQPSFVTGSDQQFYYKGQPMRERQTDALVVQKRISFKEVETCFPLAWMPSFNTLRGADAANLSVADVDLSRCRFAGALLLDQLRIEGRCVFDHPPTGIRTGWAWPPVWRWSSRQSLFEERGWRMTIASKAAGWEVTRSERFVGFGPEPLAGLYEPPEDAQVEPGRLAILYRQLRKAQEDAKNEPGAADFYYGEMEMRRHARSTPWAERLILAAYWAVSGYGLRATRAFFALAILIAGSAAVLQYVGFPGHTPAYIDSLLYAAGSVLSLSLVIGHLPVVLTHWGDVIRMLLRIAGPVLLGLAALALRGRVKR
jgi:uncharacterized protein YjbI with pentapeptide repeats